MPTDILSLPVIALFALMCAFSGFLLANFFFIMIYRSFEYDQKRGNEMTVQDAAYLNTLNRIHGERISSLENRVQLLEKLVNQIMQKKGD